MDEQAGWVKRGAFVSNRPGLARSVLTGGASVLFHSAENGFLPQKTSVFGYVWYLTAT